LVSRTALLLLLTLALMSATVVVGSGLALAKDFLGTEKAQRIVGTKYADRISALGGDDVVLGYGGPDKIRGGDDNDKQYGGRGNDIIYSEGGFRDLVNCGEGMDSAYVDSKDSVVGCERKR
jgi:Ca2+-binding RTX toxin-like protein